MSNSKKNLLNEGTIRRFMKLAEIDKLSDGFVDGLVVEEVEEPIEEAHCGKRDEEVEEGMGMMPVYDRDDEEEMDAAPDADDLDMADAAAGMDLDAEPAADAEPNEALADAVAKLMAVVSDLTGVDIAVDAGEEEEAELPAEEPMEEGAHEEDELEEGAHEEDELEEGAHEEEELEEDFDQEAFVSEVVARVHARLSKEGREEATVDQLAERIIQRIKEQSSK